MQTTALGRNDAALITPVYAAAEYDLTAGGGTDAAEQTLAVIDLATAFDTKRFASATLVLAATATLAEAKTLVLGTAKWEHSDDGVTYTAVKAGVTALTLTGPTGGATVKGAAVLGLNVAEAKRYVRAKYTPDLNASGTDTAKVSSVYLFTNPSLI